MVKLQRGNVQFGYLPPVMDVPNWISETFQIISADQARLQKKDWKKLKYPWHVIVIFQSRISPCFMEKSSNLSHVLELVMFPTFPPPLTAQKTNMEPENQWKKTPLCFSVDTDIFHLPTKPPFFWGGFQKPFSSRRFQAVTAVAGYPHCRLSKVWSKRNPRGAPKKRGVRGEATQQKGFAVLFIQKNEAEMDWHGFLFGEFVFKTDDIVTIGTDRFYAIAGLMVKNWRFDFW